MERDLNPVSLKCKVGRRIVCVALYTAQPLLQLLTALL